MTTIYIRGSGAGIFNPPSTVSAVIECWGGGGGGTSDTDPHLCGGGGYYAKKNSYSFTAGTPVNLYIASAALSAGGNPGDETWFDSTTTVRARGGGCLLYTSDAADE